MDKNRIKNKTKGEKMSNNKKLNLKPCPMCGNTDLTIVICHEFKDSVTLTHLYGHLPWAQIKCKCGQVEVIAHSNKEKIMTFIENLKQKNNIFLRELAEHKWNNRYNSKK